MTKTFQVISVDIAPNGYKGFGANPRRYRIPKIIEPGTQNPEAARP